MGRARGRGEVARARSAGAADVPRAGSRCLNADRDRDPAPLACQSRPQPSTARRHRRRPRAPLVLDGRRVRVLASRVATLADASAALRSRVPRAISSPPRSRAATHAQPNVLGGVLPRAETRPRATRRRGLPPLSRLDGAPVAVKDNFVVPGAPTPGSRALFALPWTPTPSRPAARGSARRARCSSPRPTWTSSGWGANRNSAHGACVSPGAAEGARVRAASASGGARRGRRRSRSRRGVPRSAVAVARARSPSRSARTRAAASASPPAWQPRRPQALLRPRGGWGLVPCSASTFRIPRRLRRRRRLRPRRDPGRGPLDPTTIDADRGSRPDLAAPSARRPTRGERRRGSGNREPPEDPHRSRPGSEGGTRPTRKVHVSPRMLARVPLSQGEGIRGVRGGR